MSLPPDHLRSQPEETLLHRDQCIASTLDHFTYQFYPMAPDAVGLESKFLGDDVYYPDPQDQIHFRIRNVEASVASAVEELRKKRVIITPDWPHEQRQLNSQEIRTRVNQLRQHAASLHALSTLDEQSIKETFADPWSLNLRLELYPFRSRGWDIQPAQDGSLRLLVRLDSEEPLQMINLETLYERDPQYIQGFIRQYHDLERLNVLLDEIGFNLGIHELPAQAIMPRWLISLFNRPEQLNEEIAGIANLASWFCRLDDGRFRDYFKRTFPIINNSGSHYSTQLPEGQKIFLGEYLAHVATCPGVDNFARQTAQRQLEILDAIAAISLPYPPEPPPEIAAKEWDIFQNPLAYTEPILTASEKSNKKGLKEYPEFLEFLEASVDIQDDESLWSSLEAKLPKLHQKLRDFESWSGKGYLHPTKLEDVVDACRAEVWRAITRGGISLNLVTDIVQVQLGATTASKSAKEQRAWGTRAEERLSTEARFYLSDPRLESLVICLVAKSTINYINRRRDDIGATRTAELLGRVKKVEGALIAEYRGKIAICKENLDEIRGKRQLMAEFLQRTRLTPEDIESLKAITTGKKRGERREPDYSGENRFSILFNTFYLGVTEQIDLSSPTILALLEEFFPEVLPTDFQRVRDIVTRKAQG